MPIHARDTNGRCRARRRGRRANPCERGYALVALLAMMTVLALAVTAAAPVIRQQSQREREIESIARGEEVAEAIRQYIRVKRTPPTSIDQLTEGVPDGVKKRYVLRAAAARDPLSESGEWRLIRQNDREFIDFVRHVAFYGGGRLAPTTDPALQPIDAQVRPYGAAPADPNAGEKEPCGEDSSSSGDGPFVGVASRSRCGSIISYYGIERRDKWVFTPLFK